MKKIIVIVLSLLMLTAFCGCDVSVTEPEEIVDGFFQAMKDKDEDVLILYTENSDMNTLLHCTGDEEQVARMYENVVKNLSWKIVSVEKSEDQQTAAVEVEISNTNMSGVLKAYQKKASSYMREALYDEDVTKDGLNAKCLELYVDQIEKAAAETENLVVEVVTVQLTKNEDYSWDMEMSDELMKAIIGGLKFLS